MASHPNPEKQALATFHPRYHYNVHSSRKDYMHKCLFSVFISWTFRVHFSYLQLFSNTHKCLFAVLISWKFAFQVAYKYILERMSEKWNITYSFVIQRITWNCFGVNDLLGESPCSYTKDCGRNSFRYNFRLEWTCFERPGVASFSCLPAASSQGWGPSNLLNRALWGSCVSPEGGVVPSKTVGCGSLACGRFRPAPAAIIHTQWVQSASSGLIRSTSLSAVGDVGDCGLSVPCLVRRQCSVGAGKVLLLHIAHGDLPLLMIRGASDSHLRPPPFESLESQTWHRRGLLRALIVEHPENPLRVNSGEVFSWT